ncbi:MAG: NnrS family protein [Acidiferrobacter sp.]
MRLFDAPHRPFFLGGLVQVQFALVLWSLWLLGAFAGVYAVPPLPVSAIVMHGFFMLYGIFPFFVFGFLATTYPRWMRTEGLDRRDYRNPVLLRVAGLVLVYSGLVFGPAEIVAGIMIMAVGDAWLVFSLLRIYRRATIPARRGVAVLNGTLCAEVVGLVLYAAGLFYSNDAMVALAIRVGLFLFLVPTLFTVSYRMIPFFTAAVLPHYQRPPLPPWVPLAFLAGTAAHLLVATFGARALLGVIDAALSIGSWYCLKSWFRRDAFHHGLLLLLYAGFAWLGLGWALYVVRDASDAAGSAVLGRAPLHALGLGFALSLVIAMVTRVTRGHSGRALQSDRFSWFALGGVQLAALFRIAASFPVLDRLASINLSVLAAPIAVLALAPWAIRYSAILVTSRVDG